MHTNVRLVSLALAVSALTVSSTSHALIVGQAPPYDDSSTPVRLPNGTVAHTTHRTIYLIKATELAAVPSGSSIRQLGFVLSVVRPTGTLGTAKIYLQNTADATNLKSTTWATAIGGMTQVYGGAYNLPAAPQTTFDVTLSADFVYDGGAIYIAVDYLGSTFNAGAASYQTNSGGLAASVFTAFSSTTTPPSVLTLTASFRPVVRLGYALAQGGVCATATDCANGMCIDGVCCEDACGGGALDDCMACSVAAGSSQDGLCRARPDLTVCNDGNVCTLMDTCSAGVCLGSTPIDCPAPTECNTAAACDPVAGCAYAPRPLNDPCSTDGAICTADVCDGAGNCTHLPGNAGAVCRPAVGACDVDEVCDGIASACGADVLASGAVSCRTASCTEGMATQAASCDGAGACPMLTTVSCAPYACDSAGLACATTCASDLDCTAPAVCAGNICGEAPVDQSEPESSDLAQAPADLAVSTDLAQAPVDLAVVASTDNDDGCSYSGAPKRMNSLALALCALALIASRRSAQRAFVAVGRWPRGR